MEKYQALGLIMALSNMIPGILLAWFHKSIGTSVARLGKHMHLDRLVHAKLYEERNARKFILIVGICLTAWGVIAFFLLPIITGK